ncbi:PRC-barrel domain-containing protein [Palleronia sp. LCG004]|uniref:PRC-barrel domain-containing protein n=1 Tax=Palleronia sp. LCG004 TaxID=3079304 RepID=UPI002942CF17|nr:PRC-barrel domain-containing protein [Palleronia sp. LCG004]WOI55308.1 PRC-barrel domain-containing protein [Palleronia sp. LCG004]
MTMFTNKTATAMLVGMLAVAPVGAFAQSSSETSEDPAATTATEGQGEMTTEGGTESGDMATEGSSEGMSGDGMSGDNMSGDEMASEEQPAQPVEGQIVMQDEDSILANDLIGSPVYSQDGDSIGEINDMIVQLDGTVQGIVIGVGGFLGIGEKSVALEMDSLSTQTDENGNIQLVTSATQEDLEAAEAFVDANQQEAMEQQQQATEQQGDAMSGEGSGMATDGMATSGGGTGEGTAPEAEGTQSQ